MGNMGDGSGKCGAPHGKGDPDILNFENGEFSESTQICIFERYQKMTIKRVINNQKQSSSRVNERRGSRGGVAFLSAQREDRNKSRRGGEGSISDG